MKRFVACVAISLTSLTSVAAAQDACITVGRDDLKLMEMGATAKR